MLDIVQQLVAAKLQVQANPGASITVSLDLNDPNVQKLAKFAKKLLLPTTKIHASGLVTKTGVEIPERAEDFVDALRKVVGDEIMDELQGDLNAQLAVKQQTQDTATLKDSFADPITMGGLVDGLLHSEHLREGLASGDVEKVGNMAEAMKMGRLQLPPL